MTCSSQNVQPISLVVHETQIYDVINDDFGSKTTMYVIYVYSTLLIESLRVLYEEGVDVDDVYTCDYFKLCAMLFYTINDFSVYDNLSGYNVKGHKVCPIC